MNSNDALRLRNLAIRNEEHDGRIRRVAAEIPPLQRRIDDVIARIAEVKPLHYNGEDLYPHIVSDPGAAIEVTAYRPVDDRPIVHRGGYRTAPLARVATPARRGFRAIFYQGNDLSLRARPASTWRILTAWLRGAVARLWWRNRTEWPTPSGAQTNECNDYPMSLDPALALRRIPRLVRGTLSGGPS